MENIASGSGSKYHLPFTFKSALVAFVVFGIVIHLVLRMIAASELANLSTHAIYLPIYLVLLFGGVPLVYGLLLRALKMEFGSDLLAGISIVISVILQEYLAGALVVLMLSGGEALELYASGKASSILKALAERMPRIAHRRKGEALESVDVDSVTIGDTLIVFPHEACPVDGVVLEGHGSMNEAFLTGEPYRIAKAPGIEVISGAINGESALTIRATRAATDSRYQSIARVMAEMQEKKIGLRRLGDQLGAFYTPVSVLIAGLAWWLSGDPVRFLSVLVVATPCPLLIAIPVAIIGSVSLAAKRGIIIRDPVVFERASLCTTIILDKTGTLTYGVPVLAEEVLLVGDKDFTLRLVSALEQYSKHPLATAVVEAAKKRMLPLVEASQVAQKPGVGLVGLVGNSEVIVTSRAHVTSQKIPGFEKLPNSVSGLECVVVLNGVVAALYRFKDEPRDDSSSFVRHLKRNHAVEKVMIVSGDREEEVKALGARVGISEVYGGKSPEDKVAIVMREKELNHTMFVGDGINDAPALIAATVGVAFGHQSAITSEAAGAVILDTSLKKVDEFLHIAKRMRGIALQSAIGGMIFSVGGMGFAAMGLLTPVAGAILQEVIDLLAILNALRVASVPKNLTDY